MKAKKKKEKLKILVTGGSGRFGSTLKKIKTLHNLIFPTKKQLDILNINSIRKNIRKYKPDIFIHMAGLSRPMNIHDKNIINSISLNIIGTANVTIACSEKNIKLIYFSTNFVYPGTKGNFSENSDLNPFNNYGWSKLGGETSVRLYENSLILRVCMTEEPFIHKEAFSDVITNFIYHGKVAEYLMKIINLKGVINVGGKSQSVYNFAKKNNVKVKKVLAKNFFGKNYPLKQNMNIKKLKKIIKI